MYKGSQLDNGKAQRDLPHPLVLDLSCFSVTYSGVQHRVRHVKHISLSSYSHLGQGRGPL